MKRNKKLIINLAILLGVGFIAYGAFHSRQETGAHSQKGASKYYCPMHPQVISDKPGECPICHMRLVPADSGESQEDSLKKMKAENKERKLLFYRNPMDPNVKSPVPAIDNMGMDYIPVYSDEVSGEKSDVAGHIGVSIGPEKQQLIGIKISTVKKLELKKEITTVGRIAYDPDLYQAQAEFIQASKALENVKKEVASPMSGWAESLVKSAKTKLVLMGLNEDMMESISKNEGPDESLLSAKLGEESWVYANIYEYEIPLVKVGQAMEVRVPAFAGAPLEGKIMAIDALVDPMTRSVKVRGKVKNENGFLKPELFVNVVIKADIGMVLAVPEEAILLSGNKATAFVEKEDGYFEPRSVIVGQKTDGFYEIKEGLMEGEKVVTNGNFFVDSESRLKAALSGMGTGEAS